MKIGFLKMFLLTAIFTFSMTGAYGPFLASVPSVWATSDEAKDKDGDEHKVTLCHFPPGNPESPETLSVAESSLDAHLAHGDYVGKCPECMCPPGVASCVCANGKDGTPTPASTAPSPSSQRNILGK